MFLFISSQVNIFMQMNNNLTHLERFLERNPNIMSFYKADLCQDYNCFVSEVKKTLFESINDLQRNKNIFYSNSNEDLLTIYILKTFTTLGFNASHGINNNGSVDIKIGIRNYIWLGEAKIYHSNKSAEEGFEQLTTRYSTGVENEDKGGLLLYIFQPNAKKVMQNWYRHLDSLSSDFVDLSKSEFDESKLTFLTTHTHVYSGRPYKVIHLPVILYFKPQDRSGKQSKKFN